ncbi:iron-containing alcohol dehydrogenase [Alkalihalobacillus oceani]|uniref:iron-containing alcohol dehydrogenase n=1 Tax=Halalkalibacter oceani TaxID=1653776 RepID=UPI00203DC16E|nr:iron-containing alcohol dehydrogenase [Halalkalibacter oceani]MCM3760305.1 iron-containing alcohol dehydrogenase [Halalkalibacter oceani]
MSIASYQHYMPTKVECGIGYARKTGEILKPLVSKKVLLVTDQGVRAAGLLENIEKSLNDSQLAYDIFDEVEPNPSAEVVQKGVAFLNEHNCDVVLAIGGGSSIDTAKAIAAMATNEGDILDYEGVGVLPKPTLPLIAVPTTAGTGSEVTASTIVTNKETLFKTAIISPYLFPKIAILDAELTKHCPQGITAATGMDALTHAIESYTSKTANPISQALAIHAVKLIGQYIQKAYFVGTDMESREKMLVASMIAGYAFSQSRLGNVHAISHSFGGVFNIPHGIANATLLPFVMKYNLPACPAEMKDIAVALGKDVTGLSDIDAGQLALEAVIELNHSLGIPDNIKDLGVTLDRLDQLVKDSMRSGNVLINPRLTRDQDIQAIIENAYYGRM